MSMRKLPPDIYRNLKKLELSAQTKTGQMEETAILEGHEDDDDPRPMYVFVILLSFGQRTGYIYDREGLHIPEPESFTYSVERWKFRGSQLKGVETLLNKVKFDVAVKTYQEQQEALKEEGYKLMHY